MERTLEFDLLFCLQTCVLFATFFDIFIYTNYISVSPVLVYGRGHISD